jgi:hypothetical protein
MLEATTPHALDAAITTFETVHPKPPTTPPCYE